MAKWPFVNLALSLPLFSIKISFLILFTLIKVFAIIKGAFSDIVFIFQTNWGTVNLLRLSICDKKVECRFFPQIIEAHVATESRGNHRDLGFSEFSLLTNHRAVLVAIDQSQVCKLIYRSQDLDTMTQGYKVGNMQVNIDRMRHVQFKQHLSNKYFVILGQL